MHGGRRAVRSLTVIACLCLAAPLGAAQTEKIQLRLVPLPDQWVQFHLVQEMSTVPADKEGDKVLPDIQVKSVATFTQTTGHPDADGRVRAEVTYDELSATMTTDGKTKPVAVPSSLLGQQMIATYDSQGKLVDIQAPGEIPAAVTAQIKQMMTTAFAGLGSSSFAIGETVSMPINLTLPASPTTPGPALTGTATMTLRSINDEGGERIAHFDQKMDLAMETARTMPPSGSANSATMTMSMKMVGTGTMDYNVNRGFMVANRLQSRIDTATSSDKRLPNGMPNFEMHMLVKMSIDATY